mmetsp:Transcript_12301/g.22258  ORF Transcript_12301/g.22258 Transcript_12301/m.22258 type:complete len:448 (+) Transcript_12301:378-1721(+)
MEDCKCGVESTLISLHVGNFVRFGSCAAGRSNAIGPLYSFFWNHQFQVNCYHKYTASGQRFVHTVALAERTGTRRGKRDGPGGASRFRNRRGRRSSRVLLANSALRRAPRRGFRTGCCFIESSSCRLFSCFVGVAERVCSRGDFRLNVGFALNWHLVKFSPFATLRRGIRGRASHNWLLGFQVKERNIFLYGIPPTVKSVVTFCRRNNRMQQLFGLNWRPDKLLSLTHPLPSCHFLQTKFGTIQFIRPLSPNRHAPQTVQQQRRQRRQQHPHHGLRLQASKLGQLQPLRRRRHLQHPQPIPHRLLPRRLRLRIRGAFRSRHRGRRRARLPRYRSRCIAVAEASAPSIPNTAPHAVPNATTTTSSASRGIPRNPRPRRKARAGHHHPHRLGYSRGARHQGHVPDSQRHLRGGQAGGGGRRGREGDERDRGVESDFREERAGEEEVGAG